MAVVSAGAAGEVHRAHKCVPKSAASSITCAGWSKEVKSYCGSTRKGHVFWASNGSPIAAAANSALDSGEMQLVRDVLGKIDFVSQQARRARSALFLKRANCVGFWDKRSQWLRGSYEGEYVSAQQEKWVKSAFVSAYRSGLPIPKSHCFAEYKTDVDSGLSHELYATMDGFMRVIRKTANVLHERTRRAKNNTFFNELVRCWKKLYYSRDGTISVYPFNCRVMTVAGVRRDGVFAIPIGYTNSVHNESKPEGMRLVVGEQWSLNQNGKIRAHLQNTYRRGDNTTMLRNTTTLFAAWGGGKGVVSHFGIIRTAEGPAVRHVLKTTEKHARNALDSITASNVAILVLPAMLALIPISVIEYLSRSSLYISIVFTDVIPVLPLAIKGVELLLSGRTSHTGCAAHTVGTENSVSKLAVVELWCAQCDMDPKISHFGAAFFAAAVILMFTGICVELGTYRSLRRRIKHIEECREDVQWWQRPALRAYVKRRSSCSSCAHLCSRSASVSLDGPRWS